MQIIARAILCAIALLCTAPAWAVGILPLSGQQQFDITTGVPLNGGCLYIYMAATTTPLTTYKEVGLVNPQPEPIVLDISGRIPPVFGADGTLRIRLYSKNTDGSPGCLTSGTLQLDFDNIAIVTAASSGGSQPIPDSTQLWGTRDVKIRFDDQPLEGYVRLNGRTIGSASSGASERANADTQSLFTQLWVYANISVVGGKGASAASDWANNAQLTLPDMSGRLVGAMDDLGNGAQGRITSATVTGPTVIGASGGSDDGGFSVAQTNLPNVNFAVTATVSNTTVTIGDGKFSAQTPASYQTGGSPFPANTLSEGSSSLGITGTLTSNAVTGNAASGGSGTAIKVLPPVMLFMVYLKL